MGKKINLIDTSTVPIGGWGSVPGLISPGNVNLYDRPNVRNTFADPQGTSIVPNIANPGYSTVRSMSFEPVEGGPEVLVPTVINGRLVSEEEARQHYQDTGENMGVFANPDAADAYAEQYHNDAAAQRYNSPHGLTLRRPRSLSAAAGKIFGR